MSPLGVYEDIYNIDGIGKLNIGVYVHSNLSYILFGFFYTIVFIFAVVLFYLYYSKKLSLNAFFLLSAVTFGLILYMVFFPPWSTNDSDVHYLAAYRYASIMDGANIDNAWVARLSDIYFYKHQWKLDTFGIFPNPDMESYYSAYIGLQDYFADSVEIYDSYSADRMLFYKIFNYLPLSLGIFIGRVLGGGTCIAIYMGRALEGIVIIGLLYHAIKKIPTGKSIVALVSLLPMMLMQMTAYGYDGILYAVVINVIADILQCRFEPEKRNKKTDFLGMLFAFMLGAIKGGGYLVILPLYLILIHRPLRDKRNRYPILCCSIAVISILVFDYILQEPSQQFFQLGYEESNYMSASFAYQHPITYIEMFIRTIVDRIDYLVYSIFGSNLGWNEPIVPILYIVAMLLIISIAALFEPASIVLGRKEKHCIYAALGLLFLLTPVMLLSATVKGDIYINGIQGRYFLPAHPLIVITIISYIKNTYTIHLNSEEREWQTPVIQQKCLIGFAIISILVVYSMIRVYLIR